MLQLHPIISSSPESLTSGIHPPVIFTPNQLLEAYYESHPACSRKDYQYYTQLYKSIFDKKQDNTDTKENKGVFENDVDNETYNVKCKLSLM